MIVDLILLLLVIAAVVVAAHYRAKAKAVGTAQLALQLGLRETVSTELEIVTGSMRSVIDHKFEALGKWLVTELVKRAPAERPAAAVPDGPLAPITDDGAAQMLAQMEAMIAGLTEKKAKLEGVLKAKQQADNALREVLVGE